MKEKMVYSMTPANIRVDELGGDVRLEGRFTEEMKLKFKQLDVCNILMDSGDWLDLSPLIERRSEIKELSISSISVDWSSIPLIDQLNSLKIWDKLGSKIEYGKLKSLTELWVHGSDKYIEQVYEMENLKDLRIVGWRELDLEKLSGMKSLESLELVDARKLESMNGIESLKYLKCLSIDGAPKLTDVNAWSQSKNLKTLTFSSCNKINLPEKFEGLKLLKTLGLSRNEKFQSLLPFQSCESLEKIFVFQMSVLDGDLAFLTDLPKLKGIRVQPKKHYNIDVVKLEEELILKFGDCFVKK